jgi:hypothetical protein
MLIGGAGASLILLLIVNVSDPSYRVLLRQVSVLWLVSLPIWSAVWMGNEPALGRLALVLVPLMLFATF